MLPVHPSLRPPGALSATRIAPVPLSPFGVSDLAFVVRVLPVAVRLDPFRRLLADSPVLLVSALRRPLGCSSPASFCCCPFRLLHPGSAGVFGWASCCASSCSRCLSTVWVSARASAFCRVVRPSVGCLKRSPCEVFSSFRPSAAAVSRDLGVNSYPLSSFACTGTPCPAWLCTRIDPRSDPCFPPGHYVPVHSARRAPVSAFPQGKILSERAPVGGRSLF